MSKTALNKELSKMDNAQLVQIILDAYSARPEIKEYFEFFLNPDVDKLLEKHLQKITKELSRTKWGYSKARTSVLKKEVKNFIGFAPGHEAVIDMYFMTLSSLAQTEYYINFTPTQEKYVSALVGQIIKYSNDHLLFSDSMERFQSLLDSSNVSGRFKYLIRTAMATTL